MKIINKVLKNIIPIFTILFVLASSLIYVSGAKLQNSVQVWEGEELTYYINVYYDGKDVYGVASGDEVTANVTSDIITVEDRLPDGLTFEGFVTTESGEIGAVSRKDGSACLGYVIDGENGLNYNEETRTVSFKVKNLQAGCVLNVGVITKTPILDEGEKRLDFYNTATAIEGLKTAVSNTVHTWIGITSTEKEDKYKVTYEYEGEVPENATPVPGEQQYIEGATVSLNQSTKAPGYIFSGWIAKNSSVSISNGKFTMPKENVVLVGSFTKDENFVSHKVTYKIAGNNIPEDYILPKEKTYYPEETVNLDVLKVGDVYGDYRFKGWKIQNENIKINDNSFSMPNEDVMLVGEWELVTYKVEYQFMGDIIPPNSEDILPETKSYRPGDTIILENINNPEGYEFMGWYHTDNFEMPTEDIVIYGEWKYQTTKFSPKITKKVIDKKDYYSFGDIVEFEITVTAPAETDIYDVYVKENNEKAKFINGNNYEVVTDTIVRIPELKAGESITIKSEYKASVEDNGQVINEVEIVGALANNNYEFDNTLSTKATDEFKIDSQLKICNTVEKGKGNRNIQYHITGNEYDAWIVLKENECQNLYLIPGEYNILEVTPQEYELTKVSGITDDNDSSFEIGLGQQYKVTFDHNYIQKGFYHSFGSIINIIKNKFNE